MLFMLRLVAIAAFLIAANLNLFAQQDTSGWVQMGNNILLNKHEIGTILQAGLSSTGDSIWTFSDDNGYFFRIWELKSGMMVYEKTFSERYFISADFQTYHNNHATEFKLYDIKTDSFLLSHNFFTSVYDDVQAASFHYDSKRTLLHMAYYNWEYNSRGPIPKRGMKVYKLSDVPELINHNSIEIGFKLNHDYTRMAFPRENNSIATYDIVNQKYSELGKSGQMITSVLFTSNPKHVSARYAGNILSIWNVNTKQMISKTNLKQKFFTYSFADNDKFIVGEVNFCFVLIDIITGALIESTEHYLVNIRYILDKSPHGFVFISDNKFGLVNFDILGDKDIIQFAPDSSLIYAGNSATLHNLSNFEYDVIEWELSDGRKSNQETPSFDFNTPGLFDVTLRLTKDGELFTLTKENCIEVYPVLEVDFDSDVKYGKSPLTVQFEDKSSGIVDEYIWKVNDEVFSKEKNPQYVFTKSGRFNISLTVRDRLSTKVITKPYFIQVDRENIEFLEVLLVDWYSFNSDHYAKKSESIDLVNTFVFGDTIGIILNFDLYVVGDMVSATHTYDQALLLNKDNFDIFVFKEWQSNLNITSVSNIATSNNSIFCCKFGNSANYSLLQKIYTKQNINEKKQYVINFPMKYNKRVLSFDDDKLVVCGTSRLGHTNIYKFDSELELFNQDSIQEFMIDAVNYDKDHFLMLTKDTVNSIYSLNFYDLNLDVKEIYPLSLPDEMVINSMILLPGEKIAIGGTIGNQNIGFLGVIDLNGNLLWHKTFPDWQNFNKLYLNKNNFFATGQNFDKDIGFVEIDPNGSDYFDNRLSNVYMNIAGLDILTDSVVILTYYRSNELYLCKVRYNPLEQAKGGIDTSSAGGPPSILPVPNPAENSVTLQFAESLIVQKVQVYDYSGIEVMQFTLPQSPVYEVLLPLHALSIGMYHVTVTTDSGILRTKFIKY